MIKHPDELLPDNDEHNVVDLLIAAHGIAADTVTKHFIELALLHEGRKISSTLMPDAPTDRLNRAGS